MTLVLQLPPDLESELSAEANRLGLSIQDHALRLLSAAHAQNGQSMTGAELVAYWQREGLAGSRPDISDSQAHARALRQEAERRQQSI